MTKLNIPLPGRDYDILIEPGLLDQAGAHCRTVLPRAKKLAVVTDTNVAPLYAARAEKSLAAAGFAVRIITIPAGETSKSMQMLEFLYDEFMAFGLTRTDAVVALGGGVVGDLAGFAAATLLRGVTLAHVPTTLLAQADSAIGGKTGLNLPEGKNLLGAFWQPALVLSDTACLATLPPRQLSSGMAEVIKCACIADAPLLDALEEPSPPAPEKLAAACCRIKARCVAADERDSGLRRLLNFGHTFGHAYEALGGYQAYTHGEAVAAGMAQMLRWQMAHGLGGDLLLARLEHLLAHYGLPAAIDCGGDALRRYLSQDKKTAGARITIVVVERAGEGRLEEVPLSSLWEGCQ